MSETADQVPTEGFSEYPVAEITAERLEPQTPEPEPTAKDEAVLTAEIAELWRRHSDFKGSIKSQTENLRCLRAELGKRLSEMKQLLSRPGRNGQWSGWLKQNRISRATADRLVLQHERALHPDWNRLSEQITEPTEEEIQTLLDKVTPKLRLVMRTPLSAYKFIDLLSASVGLNRKETEGGFIVLKPPVQTTVEQSIPEEVQVEPAPIIADVLAESDLQATSSLTAL
jgi:hypothetical protein